MVYEKGFAMYLKKHVSMFNYLLILLLTLFVTSCATSKAIQDDSYRILGEFAGSLSNYVEYDPYSATLHYDRNQIQGLFEQTKMKLRNNGCGYVGPYYIGVGSEDDFIKYKVKEYGIQNDEWKRSLYQQIVNEKEGWAIAQVEYPRAGLQHGDFTVKSVIMFLMGWCGGNGMGGDYGIQPAFYFDVKNKSLEQKPLIENNNSKTEIGTTVNQENSAKKKTQNVNDAINRLKKLKEMLDGGLINQEEYAAKKQKIIDEM